MDSNACFYCCILIGIAPCSEVLTQSTTIVLAASMSHHNQYETIKWSRIPRTSVSTRIYRKDIGIHVRSMKMQQFRWLGQEQCGLIFPNLFMFALLILKRFSVMSFMKKPFVSDINILVWTWSTSTTQGWYCYSFLMKCT